MSAVNPLVVMDRYAADFRPNQGFDGEDMRQARELVSNLLAADREYDRALAASRIGYGNDAEDAQAYLDLQEAIHQRRMALAAFGGVL